MRRAEEQRIKNYMRLHIEEHIDSGGWIVCTSLAEETASMINVNLDDCFEYAIEVAHEYEATHLHAQ